MEGHLDVWLQGGGWEERGGAVFCKYWRVIRGGVGGEMYSHMLVWGLYSFSYKRGRPGRVHTSWSDAVTGLSVTFFASLVLFIRFSLRWGFSCFF